jgi:hypothetical protein
MRGHAYLTPFARAVLATALFGCFAPPALAGEATYCVTCKNPDQTYLCQVTGDDLSQNDALKLYCIVRTAKEGKHASCSAHRDASSCNGIEKTYSYDGPAILPDLADDPRVKHLTDRVVHDQNAFEKPKGNAPKTLVELTGRAVSAARNGWRNARAAFGDTSKTDQPGDPSDPPLAPPVQAAALPPQPSAPTSASTFPTSKSTSQPTESRSQRVKHATQNAGAAVGHFTRNSYRCLRSLFRNCGSEAQAQASE